MANDMDIDMDIDIGLTDDLVVPHMDATPDIDFTLEPKAILSAPNDIIDSSSQDPMPDKVHLRGLDNLTTDDIKAFASEYFDSHKPVHIEWIDDTSANLVYESADIASEALRCFAVMDVPDISQLPALQTLQAKAFPAHTETNLQVRRAVVSDRKQAGARERSRFYLFNPEYDPAERRKRAAARGPRRYRDRDDGGYRSQKYDDYEQRKRERDADFDASLYDDDEAAIAQRRAKHRRKSSSGTDSRDQRSRRGGFRDVVRKELFPGQVVRDNQMLRDRSASPLRDSDEDQAMAELQDEQSRKDSSAAAANRLKAQMIKAQLRESGVRELFPQKTSISHRRSDAFDAADETADLFANRMAVPFMDGSGDARPRNSRSLASRVSKVNSENESFIIRGIAKAPTSTTQNFNIKGAASGIRVKELFPTLGENAGKELFSERLESRKGQRRQKAEDLFY